MAKLSLSLLSMLLGGMILLSCGDSKKRHSEEDDDESSALSEKFDDDELDLEPASMEPYVSHKLRNTVELLNVGCPVSLGVADLTSITCDETTVTFNYDIIEDFMNISILADNPEKAKASALTMLANPSDNMKSFYDAIIADGALLKIIMHGKKSGATATMTYTAEELEEAINHEVSPEEKLMTAIESTNEQFPMTAATGMTITEIRLIGNNATYIAMLDESVYNMDLFKQNKEQARQSIMNTITGMGLVEKQFLKLIVDAGKNLAYRYQGKSSGKSVDVVISNAELDYLLR